jgi:hypothetical protein
MCPHRIFRAKKVTADYNEICHCVNRKCNRKSVLTRARNNYYDMLKFHRDELNGEGYRSRERNNIEEEETLQEQ